MEPDNPLAAGLAGDRHAPPCVLVVFGASGDLTSRKLMPAVEQLAQRRLLSTSFAVVGVARTEWSDDDFRARMREAVKDAGPEWEHLTSRFRYVAGDYADSATFDTLATVLDELDAELGTAGSRVFYLATVPGVFAGVAKALGDGGLASPGADGGFARLVIEKPFGHDLESARQLDVDLHAVFAEEQIYRIDHYLGKETVQNLLALRFANAIFEPIWNRNYVDHVQITVAESVGVGHRGGFYETAGALRDIVQNHVMQVLALTAMEPPVTIDAQGIRDEKVKALRAIDVLTPDEVADHVVRGQYDAGWVEGEEVVGYRDEEGISDSSVTDTYVAMRLRVDNWRWAGVPFYVRTGKRLPKRLTEVAMQFREVPHLPFPAGLAQGLGANALVLRIQPDEGITLRFGAKVPGQAFEVRSVSMDFSYGAAFLEESPEAYERLLLDAMIGDPTLFIRSDEVEQAWKVCEPILAAFSDPSYPVARYEAGTWGPSAAEDLLERDGRKWRRP
ncbi:MAG: Glucose-6-phosphate 1-dehydrogenase [uncultured Acidimicrobiales bacterium]|uniref:Glucose-6-phosphate 1-dehydrogenase n=1 Tax=uncultured Acidimicrobiales bacterium TaxID=310071 RepID=A0A6J4IUK4_9ACTN|nr:MAG: Glucose-6-phosphate 1-dehydrogenase [uncultured Acidimicrobiales bacterium]